MKKRKKKEEKLTIGTVPKSNKKHRSKRQNRYLQQQKHLTSSWIGTALH
jgi:hypothetical protein